jgi:hypothetical protein
MPKISNKPILKKYLIIPNIENKEENYKKILKLIKKDKDITLDKEYTYTKMIGVQTYENKLTEINKWKCVLTTSINDI